MSTELDRPGGGVAAFMRSVGRLLVLEKSGTLAYDELADIVERSLATLKTMDAETSVRSQAAWGIGYRSPRTTSRASRSRSEPETARGDAICLIIAICGSRERVHGG